ncbi:MAG: C4-dicarboxylate ABC transporter permease [Hyphomicrobiales bacterium]|nr:MAG: C4-dicarboxylate ABC transporter permease [Hyphomicrobiales bacterium]
MNFLIKLATGIDRLNEIIGRGVAWVALLMVLVQFTVVIMRYVFAIGFIPMQESIWYMHGILFMVGAGYTLLHDGHVRVDIIYREASVRKKAWIDTLGSLFFLIPLCILTLWLSSSYVINSWKTFESSTEISGLPLIFALKTVIWVFAVLLGLQAISTLIHGIETLFLKTDETAETAAS